MVGEQNLVSVEVDRTEVRVRQSHKEERCCSCCCFPYLLSKKPRKPQTRSGSVSFRGERNCLMNQEMTIDYSSTVSTTSSSSSSSSSRSSTSPQLTSVSDETAETESKPADITPSAPPQGVLLLNSEEQSDLIFRVSPDSSGSQSWRFPAHSFIVGNASVAFQRMIEEHRTQFPIASSDLRPEIMIECKPEIFNMMMSYIYKKEVNITSTSKSLDLYSLSKRFELHELGEICITFLRKKASVHNTLEILTRLREEAEKYEHDLDDNMLNELINKCYNLVDENAEKVLCSESFQNLERKMVIEVLSRSTLKISSERLVFDCLVSWAEHQCLRQRLELTAGNKKLVLGDTLYCVRYLTMSPEDFVKGPYASDMLTQEEKACFFAKIKGASVDLPSHLVDKRLDEERLFVKPIVRVSPVVRSAPRTMTAYTLPSDRDRPDRSRTGLIVANKKKNSTSKKLLNGLGDFVICVIQLLD